MKTKHLSVILLAVLALLTFSCKKDTVTQPKKFTVTCNVSYGYSRTFTILQYNDSGEKIYSNSYSFAKGETKSFTSQNDAVKIKIYIKIESVMGDVKGWVQQVYYLNEGSTKSIVINDDTIIGNYEP